MAITAKYTELRLSPGAGAHVDLMGLRDEVEDQQSGEVLARSALALLGLMRVQRSLLRVASQSSPVLGSLVDVSLQLVGSARTLTDCADPGLWFVAGMVASEFGTSAAVLQAARRSVFVRAEGIAVPLLHRLAHLAVDVAGGRNGRGRYHALDFGRQARFLGCEVVKRSWTEGTITCHVCHCFALDEQGRRGLACRD